MLRRAEPHGCAKIAERDACLKAANAALSHPRCAAPYFYMKAALLLTLSHLLKHALNRIFTQKSGGHVRDARRFFRRPRKSASRVVGISHGFSACAVIIPSISSAVSRRHSPSPSVGSSVRFANAVLCRYTIDEPTA